MKKDKLQYYVYNVRVHTTVSLLIIIVTIAYEFIVRYTRGHQRHSF